MPKMGSILAPLDRPINSLRTGRLKRQKVPLLLGEKARQIKKSNTKSSTNALLFACVDFIFLLNNVR
jgi:hypothetical protein